MGYDYQVKTSMTLIYIRVQFIHKFTNIATMTKGLLILVLDNHSFSPLQSIIVMKLVVRWVTMDMG